MEISNDFEINKIFHMPSNEKLKILENIKKKNYNNLSLVEKNVLIFNILIFNNYLYFFVFFIKHKYLFNIILFLIKMF